MKRISAAGVFVVLALWVGYALGYYHGRRFEQRAWLSTGVIVLDKDVTVVAPGEKFSLGSLKVEKDTADGPATSRLHFYYTNPHAGMIVSGFAGRAVNAADPRNTGFK
jgi:hypothetical protein